MPVTLTPIAPDVLDGLRHGEERALERAFRDHYDALVEEAVARLDEPSHAPRLVEGAFLRAWDQRATFETPDAFETFLHQAVRDAAVRDKARHTSFHRLETNGKQNGHNGHNGHAPQKAAPMPTTDEAWRQVYAVLHAPPPDESRVAHVRHDLARHAAAEHVAHAVDIEKRSWTIPVVIVGVTALLVVPFLFWLNRASTEASVNSALAAQEARVVSARTGQRAEVNLADRTNVMLFPETKVRIPPRFNKEWRVVGLEGAGRFTVPAGQDRPFEVRAGGAVVQATSGTLAIRHYADDNATWVTSENGSAMVRAGRTSKALPTGAMLAVSQDSVITTPAPDAAAAAMAWTHEQLVVPNVPLREALKQLGRWYALDLTVHDEKLLDRLVSIDAPLDSPRGAIASIENSGGLKFGWEGKLMVLTDAPKAAATKKGR